MPVIPGAGGGGGPRLPRYPSVPLGNIQAGAEQQLGIPTGANYGAVPQPTRGQLADALRQTALGQAYGAPFTPSGFLPRTTPFPGVAVPGASGGGGGGGGGAPVENTVGQLLKGLAFPQAASLPPYLREFGKYLEDLLTGNPALAIPVPKVENGQLLVEGSQVVTQEVPQNIEAYSSMWQTFLNMLQTAGFALQQQLVGLRFPNMQTGFMLSGQRPLLPNPTAL